MSEQGKMEYPDGDPLFTFLTESRRQRTAYEDDAWPAPAAPDDDEQFPEEKNPQKKAYLVALTTTPKWGLAAQRANVSRHKAMLWREDPDPAWQTLLRRARKMAMDALESEVYRRAVDGVQEPVYQQGQLVGHKRVYSDACLLAATKANIDHYNKDKHEVTGANGEPLREIREVRVVIVDPVKLEE